MRSPRFWIATRASYAAVLQLVEKFSGDVIDHLKLGLINITIGRELARLPAGNQNTGTFHGIEIPLYRHRDRPAGPVAC